MKSTGLFKRITAFAAALLFAASLASCTVPKEPQAADISTPVPVDSGAPELTAAPTPAPTDVPTPAPTPEATPAPTAAPVQALLMFVGDLMCLGNQQHAARLESGSGEEFDFRAAFRYVRPIIESADCAFANLETTLSPNWPYCEFLRRTEDGMPNCNAPRDYLDGVKYAGFDVLSLSNNHCCDAGLQGILDTLDAVDRYGFAHTGVFRSDDEPRYTIVTVKGIKIGLVAYTESYNGKNGCVAGHSYMINTYGDEKVVRDVYAVRQAGAEFVIAYPHWDKEHLNAPISRTEQRARVFANAGVDLIVGAHPHAIQPVEWITALDGRKVLCMYSLGNFASCMTRDTARDSVIAKVVIRKDSDGKVRIVSDDYIPCRIFQGKLNGHSYVILPTTCREFPGKRSELDAAHERIMKIINARR